MSRTADKGTYVFGVVAGLRRPALPGGTKGPVGAGPVRILEFDVAGGRRRMRSWIIVADVPLSRYGAAAINRRLNDLGWVARAATGHEAVVESFLKAPALVPMKLFTIFANDERAIKDLAKHRSHIDAVLRRVANRDEWGVRVVLNGAGAAGAARAATARRRADAEGASYLARKQHQRRAAVELVTRAREVAAEVFEALAAVASQAHRRAAGELPAANGALLIDAVFLVPRPRSKRFQAKVRREAARLAPQGYDVSLTGPWPAYSFISE